MTAKKRTGKKRMHRLLQENGEILDPKAKVKSPRQEEARKIET